jgi:hypothetical protein
MNIATIWIGNKGELIMIAVIMVNINSRSSNKMNSAVTPKTSLDANKPLPNNHPEQILSTLNTKQMIVSLLLNISSASLQSRSAFR